jgi:predicted amidophosphoribosyltransferase
MTSRQPSLWDALQPYRASSKSARRYPIDPRDLAPYLDPVTHAACPRCAQRLYLGRCPSLGCLRGWLSSLGTTHVALGYKHGDVQRLLLAAKDTVEPGAVTLLGRLLAGFMFGSPAMRSYDVILPVPFHPRGLRGRPVHPLTAIYLDAAPALRLQFPVDDLAPPFLQQVRAVPPMRRRAERERWRAVRGAFALGFRTRMLRGARIAVVDDVMTTGATLSECALVLRNEGGAAVVDAVVLVRQPWVMPRRAPEESGRSRERVDVAEGARI